MIVSFNQAGSYQPDAFFLDRDQAAVLSDAIDRALEKGSPMPDARCERINERLYVKVGAAMLSVPEDQVTTLVVCERSGQVPHECGLSACENGCPDVELTFVRAEVAATSPAFPNQRGDG